MVRAWKFIHPEYAEGALRGVFNIGTPASYRDLKDKQADPLDSGIRRTLDQMFITNALNPDEADKVALLKRMGINIQGGANFFVRNVAAIHQDNGNVLCLCRNPNNTSFGDKAAIIEIADVECLADHLTMNNPSLVGNIYIDKVRYMDVDGAARVGEIWGPSPFQKARRFEQEAELRIFWDNPKAAPLLTAPFDPPDGLLKWINRPS